MGLQLGRATTGDRLCLLGMEWMRGRLTRLPAACELGSLSALSVCCLRRDAWQRTTCLDFILSQLIPCLVSKTRHASHHSVWDARVSGLLVQKQLPDRTHCPGYWAQANWLPR